MKMTTTTRPQIVDIEPTNVDTNQEWANTDAIDAEKKLDTTPQRQDAFGDEENAEVKYKVLKWWYVIQVLEPLGDPTLFQWLIYRMIQARWPAHGFGNYLPGNIVPSSGRGRYGPCSSSYRACWHGPSSHIYRISYWEIQIETSSHF
jgi:hypothetical protein